MDPDVVRTLERTAAGVVEQYGTREDLRYEFMPESWDCVREL